MKKKLSLDEALSYFDLTPEEMPDLLPERSFEKMNKKLKQFKYRIKKAYRKVVFKYHPDHGGDEEQMKILNELYNIFMKQLKIVSIPPQSTIIMYYSNKYYSGTSTTYTDTSSNFYY
jgi:hypothetical protein